MPERIPKSVAKRVVFRAIAASDHFTPKTGVTIAITISKNGGAFGNPAAGATNATEISSGFYYFDLGSGDTGTGGPLAWRGAVATIDDVGDVYEVVNATNAGFTALPDVASGSAGAVIVSGTGTAALSVTAGVAKADLDTIKTQAVTCAAPVTVLASVGTAATSTAQTGDCYPLVDTEVAAIKAKTDNLPSDPADASDIAAAFGTVNSTLAVIAGYIDTEVAAIKAKTDNLPASPAAVSDIPTAAAISDAVWDEALAGHAGAGSTGAALSAASSAGDPWSTPLPGAYAAGTAGYVVGNTMKDAADRLLTMMEPAGGSPGEYKLTVDALRAIISITPTAIQNADALLDRDMAAGTDSGSPTVRTPRQALRILRNKWSISGATQTVTKEDDSTASWTQVLSTTAGADPVTGTDPAGP